MKSKRIYAFLLIGYLLLCGYLVLDSGIIAKRNPLVLLRQTTEVNQPQLISAPDANESAVQDANSQNTETLKPRQKFQFTIDNSTPQSFTIGADDPNTEDPAVDTNFKLQIELTNKGAGIKTVTFSDGNDNGFNNRNSKDPKPFVLLAPVKLPNGREIYSMASGDMVLPDYGVKLPLEKLNWQFAGIETADDGCEKATFIAEIKDKNTGQVVFKVTKVFDVLPNTYMMHCHLSVENFTGSEQKMRFELNGPVGISREDARADMRKAVAAYLNPQDQVISKQLDIKKMNKAGTSQELSLDNDSVPFLWAAITNKYFTAIAVPVPKSNEKYSDWIAGKSAHFYNPDGDEKSNSGDETIGLKFDTQQVTLSPAGTDNSRLDYKFQIYFGPKDKQLFDENPEYNRLGFMHTIDFPACCCPAGIIRPLAFFILWLMNAIYTVIPNYGVAIIILVFVVRFVLHPVTKAGQVRMSRFTKIISSPEVAEIKKKYKNPMEAQKKISEFQKSRGVSPADALWGMLPMLVQMPLWIALWSAVNASVNLRGAPFLPFWITDLSAPDALINFQTITIPLLGWQISSFNLLPLLMGVAFYLQQKTMPQQPAATPEAEQQQKIMKVMMLVLFPVMLYNAPSGVNLYIMASSFAGAFEQYIIRKHIEEREQAQNRGVVEVTAKTGGKVKKKKPKPFFKY
ncbi:MAG: YidC/Oxa1 family insertase periplasmic-domain containing protein [Phycisphaerae bacterium]|jgi:YidC/Oxa1 family membrane protein insertase